MAIVAIILLGVTFWPRHGSLYDSSHSPVTAAYTDIKGGIETALDQYKVDIGCYPKSLRGLVQQPSGTTNWHGPYLDRMPIDPWGNNYVYMYPGIHNTSSYDLASAGPDGRAGTEDDIVNWK